MLRSLLSFMLMFCCASIYAQSPADSIAKPSPVHTMTYQQYQDYLKGDAGADLALAGEMNHYPLPDKVLKLRKELNLNAVQIQKITEAATYLHRRRLQIGGSVISTEKMLDSMFRYNKVDDGSLIFYTNRYGLYQGELKNALLQACLSTQKQLSAKQIAKYDSLQKPK